MDFVEAQLVGSEIRRIGVICVESFLGWRSLTLALVLQSKLLDGPGIILKTC